MVRTLSDLNFLLCGSGAARDARRGNGPHRRGAAGRNTAHQQHDRAAGVEEAAGPCACWALLRCSPRRALSSSLRSLAGRSLSDKSSCAQVWKHAAACFSRLRLWLPALLWPFGKRTSASAGSGRSVCVPSSRVDGAIEHCSRECSTSSAFTELGRSDLDGRFNHLARKEQASRCCGLRPAQQQARERDRGQLGPSAVRAQTRSPGRAAAPRQRPPVQELVRALRRCRGAASPAPAQRAEDGGHLCQGVGSRQPTARAQRPAATTGPQQLLQCLAH